MIKVRKYQPANFVAVRWSSSRNSVPAWNKK